MKIQYKSEISLYFFRQIKKIYNSRCFSWVTEAIYRCKYCRISVFFSISTCFAILFQLRRAHGTYPALTRLRPPGFAPRRTKNRKTTSEDVVFVMVHSRKCFPNLVQKNIFLQVPLLFYWYLYLFLNCSDK